MAVQSSMLLNNSAKRNAFDGFIPGLHTCTCLCLICFTLADLPTGSYIQEDLSLCSSLCEAGRDCCDLMASCKCGTHTGQYDCICEKGYYGKGLQHECTGRPGLMLTAVLFKLEMSDIIGVSILSANKGI